MGLLMLMLVEIADIIGGVIFGSGYSATEVIVVVHRPAATYTAPLTPPINNGTVPLSLH